LVWLQTGSEWEIEIEFGCGGSFRLFRQMPRGSASSRDFEVLLFPDTGDDSVAKEFEEIAEMCFEIVQIIALGPVIRVVIEIAEILAIGLAPGGHLRFHGG